MLYRKHFCTSLRGKRLVSKVELSPRNDDSEVEIKFNNAKGKFSKRFDII